MVRSNPSGEPGVVVKSLTSLAIADSLRNIPQDSLAEDLLEDRVTDWRTKGRKAQFSCQTPNLKQSQMARVRTRGKAPSPKGKQPNLGLRCLNVG